MLWDVERPGDLAYPLGVNPCACVVRDGEDGAGASHMNEPQPLYAKVKDHILLHIRSGAWAPGARVPSENELVESFGISRMTANRALRELTADGFLARVPGVGTFVREAQPARSSLVELRSIADEIAARGHRHDTKIAAAGSDSSRRRRSPKNSKAAQNLRLAHVMIVHSENGVPVQLEDRYVNLEVAPDFLKQDFTRITPTAYLLSIAPVDELEHTVEAVIPTSRAARASRHPGVRAVPVAAPAQLEPRPRRNRCNLHLSGQPLCALQPLSHDARRHARKEFLMTTRRDNTRVIKAPTGTQISAKSWLTEAPLRMLMNNLDPGVAERPEELVVYGGIGRAARNWEAFDTIVASLRSLGEEETLLVQSGKPVGIFRTHKDAPRVLIANSNLVPHWGTWEKFHELDRKGLMMYGQMTAGSWIYIGTQGIVQGTYETFAEVGRKHYGGNLKGKWFLTAGLGGMGGAQPLAATMAGASMIAIECQPSRIEMRLKTRYLDTKAATIAEALEIIDRSHKAGKPVSVGLLGNAAELLPEIVSKGIRPDALTDQTSAHDPVNGYLPAGWTLAEWEAKRVSDPKAVEAAAMASMKVHVQAMLDLYKAGVPTLDYGNNIRQMAFDMGLKDAFAFPGFVPAYIRPLFCRGIGPFRWAALSGNPEDIYKTDQRVKELIPDDPHLHNWLDMARERIAFQGLPARICWVGLGQRHRLGLAFNEMVKNGEVDAPIVIGRDHLDSGSVASPNRETEAMLDGSDAVSDWPLLNALLNTASGATWVSIHHGGGVGIGYSQHAGMVIVCDGSDDAARRLERVLWNDPASGVMRHADAGYDIAIQCAKENGLKLPSLGL